VLGDDYLMMFRYVTMVEGGEGVGSRDGFFRGLGGYLGSLDITGCMEEIGRYGMIRGQSIKYFFEITEIA
jgi:hypothetical protein